MRLLEVWAFFTLPDIIYDTLLEGVIDKTSWNSQSLPETVKLSLLATTLQRKSFDLTNNDYANRHRKIVVLKNNTFIFSDYIIIRFIF